MAQDIPSPAKVEILDFPGILFDIDPHDLPKGAAEDQVNAVSYDSAELQSRRGFRYVIFEGE